MKRLLTILVSVVMLITAMPILNASADSTTGMLLYVAPNGSDANDGSEGAPLATLKGARDKIRQIKSTSGYPNGGITVVFRGGQYRWTETVDFTEEDSGVSGSPIVYRAYPGEKVYFEAGVKIPGTAFTEVTDEDVLSKWTNAKVKAAIRQVDIKSYFAKEGFTDLYDYYPLKYSKYPFGYQYRNLHDEERPEGENTGMYIRRPIYSFEGEQALWLARYPNKSGGEYADINPHTQLMTFGEIVKNGENKEPSTFKYTDRRISKYSGRDDVYMYGFPYWSYYFDESKIMINSADTTITSVKPMHQGILAKGTFCIYNIIEELDAPGEYFVDKNTGIMYVYPTGDITKTNLNVSVFDKDYMITTKKTSFVTFEGITFENSKGSGLFVNGGDSVTVQYCNFYNMGVGAMKIGQNPYIYTKFGFEHQWSDSPTQFPPFTAETGDSYPLRQAKYYMQDSHGKLEYGVNHKVYGCKIMNIGCTALEVFGGNVYRDELSGIEIVNNDITFSGVYKRTYSGAITLNNIHGILVKNNNMSHIPASAITGNFTVGTIDGNEFGDCMMEAHDMAVIYGNYNYPNLDIKFTNNYFHDTPSEYNEPFAVNSPASQRSAIAFDNNFGGIEVGGNVFKNIPRGIFLTCGNYYHDNVFVDCHMAMMNGLGTAGTYYYPSKAKNFLDKANCGTSYFDVLLSLPTNAEGEIGEHFQKLWREKYPVFMNWLDVVCSQEHKGNQFDRVENNLYVNSKVPLSSSSVRADTVAFYKGDEVINKDIKNNNCNSDTSVFADYNGGNVQMTAEGAQKYGIKALDLKTVGPQIDMVGADKYTDAKIALPTAVNSGTTTPTVSVPEQVKNAVVLKIGSSNALNNGKTVKVDPNNSAVMPNIINSRTLVPARFISESFGGEVGWDDATRTVTIKLGGKTVTMVLDNNELMIDGEVAATMDVPAQSIEGRTMVPLRALCETALSKKVFWDPKGLIVISDTDNILDSANDAGTIDTILSILK